jgi:hypothetical protein
VRDVGTVLRGVVAMLFAGAGLLHVDAALGHADEPVLQAGFALTGALQVAVGGLVLGARRPLRPLLAGGMALQAAAVGAWLLSRTRGLPDAVSPGGHVEPVGVADGICVLLELLSLPAAVLLLSPAIRALALPTPQAGRTALAVAGTAMAALLVPAIVVTGTAPLRLDADVLGVASHGHRGASRAEHRSGARHARTAPHGARRAGHATRSGHARRAHADGDGSGGEHHVQAAAGAPRPGHAHAHLRTVAPDGGAHAHHRQGPARSGARDRSSGKGHHHHGSASPAPAAEPAPAPAPAEPPAQAAAAPQEPSPCEQGTTVVDAGGTQVVYAPGTGGAGVHVC